MARPSTVALRLLSGEREPVRVATTTNVTLSGLQIIDGVTLAPGERVLVKSQTDASQNGIYDASEGVWYRAADARDTRAINKGIKVAVQRGTVGSGDVYRFTTLDPEIGTDDIGLELFLSGTFIEDLSDEVADLLSQANAAAVAAAASEASAAAIVGSGAYTQAGTGAQTRSVQSRLREQVTVTDFYAVVDGTNWTNAFLRAIAALPGGGTIFVPRGKYRVTQDLPLHSGLEFRGEGATNNFFGIPTGVETPSYIWLDGDGALFSHALDIQLESVRFFDLSFGTRITPSTLPRASTICFNFYGSFPHDIKKLTFDRCFFHNFGSYAIGVTDPLAPHVDEDDNPIPDWNVCPVMVTDCAFYFNTVGIHFNADNADYWTLTNCSFVGTLNGIVVQRGGILTLIACFGGGPDGSTPPVPTTFLVLGSGDPNHTRDTITLKNCQWEQGNALVLVQGLASQATYRPIILEGCVIESPIIAEAACAITTRDCRWVNNLEVTASGVLIDSYSDRFLPGVTSWNLAAGSEVRNFVTNGGPLPTGVRGYIQNGKHYGRGAGPINGVTYYAGDEIEVDPPVIGGENKKVCVTTGTPGTGTPGAWTLVGQNGYRSQAGSPVGTITPRRIGEEFLATEAVKWWKSTGLTNADWVSLN